MVKKLAVLVGLTVLFAQPAMASDEDELTALLHHFLATVSEETTHDRFWADDLIYTSSRGTRTDKVSIMAGFESQDESDDSSGPGYTAEEIQIQVYDDVAVVAFKLVATPSDDSAEEEISYYLNTGTFLKRDDQWQVVAWQATAIPNE